jgi:hypothetical protein
MSDRIETMKTYINGWNTNRNSAAYLYKLREHLDWHHDDSVPIADLIEMEFLSKPSAEEAQLRISHLPPLVASRYISFKRVRDAIREVYQGQKTYDHAIKLILQTSWPFTDPSGLVQKTPAELEDFLRTCNTEIGLYAELNEPRRKLLHMCFDIWLRWAAMEETKEST